MDHRWEVIAAKSNSQDSGMGLSFATHAMDTAGMMTLLYHQWLSESVRAFLADQLFPDGSTDVKEETGQWLQLLALLFLCLES